MNLKKTIGITGAGGALGRALTKIYSSNKYKIIGFTHNKNPQRIGDDLPDEWIYWECGKEYLLKDKLKEIDILILNHGIYDSNFTYPLEKSLEINAISKIKIFDLFEEICLDTKDVIAPKEIWINTSEAEILPALNPLYEISKSLIGQTVTFKKNFLTRNESKKLVIKKIIIGPFKSELNPIGIMTPKLVAQLIYLISKTNLYLIIISPNPLSYLLFPIKELYYFIYYFILKIFKRNLVN